MRTSSRSDNRRQALWDDAIEQILLGRETIKAAAAKRGLAEGSFRGEVRKRKIKLAPIRGGRAGAKASPAVVQKPQPISLPASPVAAQRAAVARRPARGDQCDQLREQVDELRTQNSELRGELRAYKALASAAGRSRRRPS